LIKSALGKTNFSSVSKPHYNAFLFTFNFIA